MKRTWLLWLVGSLCALCALRTPSAHADPVRKVHPLERASVRLFLEQTWDDHFKNPPQVLLVHGLTYSSHEFDVDHADYSLVDFLVQHGFSVWLLDIAGYGRSGAVDGLKVDSDYAAEDVAAAVAYIRKVSGDDKIDLVGWSWGTITTARMAGRHPEQIGSLVLYAPIIRRPEGATPPTAPVHPNTWDHAAEDFQRTSAGEIDFRTVEPAVAHIFLSTCWRYDGKGSPNGGRVDVLQNDPTPLFDASRLTMPVLFLTGTKDPYMSWDALEKAYSLLPNRDRSRFLRIEGGSHILMLEKDHYKRFQREVLAFLLGNR
ncbi:MAG TPA: alpha/beta fold hydrolase [Thermoanaerobaculia bacterium]|nr:alpha/beta fold hydrolase [Thermoanaerobaculia bacterium]